MKIHLDCIPCFLRQSLQAARFAGVDEITQHKILQQSLKELQDFQMDSNPLDGSLTVHNIVTRISGIKDPYSLLKKMSNQMILDNYSSYQEMIDSSKNPLETAFRLAIAGNIIDYGTGKDFDIHETVENIMKKEFALNEMDHLIENIKRVDTITYFADNAGEIVFDRLLLEALISKLGPKHIRLIVKGHPIINDAMTSDVLQAGMGSIPDLEIIAVESEGFAHHWKPESLPSATNGKEVRICKGQANYESLSDIPGHYFLLLAKCAVIAADITEQSKVDIHTGDIILWRNH